MTMEEILKAIAYNEGRFAREAVEAAIEQREAIIPHLLEILTDTVRRAEELSKEEHYFAHMYALYLLAQFRETRAYPLIVDLASLPDGLADDLLGDTITEGLGHILASVCDGDTSLIEKLIENPEADEYARGAGVHALQVLVAAGVKTRDEVMAYFTLLFRGKLERCPSAVWIDLIFSAKEMYPDEVYEDIMQAYNENLIDAFDIPPSEVDEALAIDKETALERMPVPAHIFIQDVIEEMATWACFDGQPNAEEPIREIVIPPPPPIFRMPSPSRDLSPIAPLRSEKVKPNEPCPCGSAKKYKKCCGRTAG